jgi:methionyl-tRNA formyltransferase
MTKIVYFGTTDFSAQVLKALAEQKDFEIVTVVTQRARPIGRDQIITDSPTKILATKLGIPVIEPESLKTFSPENFPTTDIFIVYAYGLIIPRVILDLPKFGALNIHPSLLPKYRGPTPVQTALIHGEVETGTSIMVLDEKMDHGPILGTSKITINPDDTTPTLTQKLVQQAIPLLIKIVPEWINKQIIPTPQNHEEASFCKFLSREDGRVDWKKTADEIYNLYRALQPWPEIWTEWNNKRLKLLEIKKIYLIL